LLLYHCYHITVTVSLLPYHCYCITVTISLLPYHCYCITVTISLLPFHCYCITVTISLLLYHCYHITVTVSLLPYHCYNCSERKSGLIYVFIYHDATAPVGLNPLIIEDSRSHSLRHTTLGRTPLYELSVPRRHLYLTTHNSPNRQTSMHPAGFEPTIPTSQRPQTHALDHVVTGTDGLIAGFVIKAV
jgi:hypothetical protein